MSSPLLSAADIEGLRAGLCAVNATYAPVFGTRYLAPEIWLRIWQNLSLSERTFVAGVRRQWRQWALASPLLWARLDFSIWRHDGSCRCFSCVQGSAPHWNPFGWRDRPSDWPWSNAQIVERVLPLSGDRPLIVTIEIIPFMAHPDAVKALANSLLPHSGRITRLCIQSGDINAAEDFLDTFTSFPKLSALSIRLLDNEEGSYSTLPLNPLSKLDLPNLNSLSLDRGYHWPDTAPALTCPHLCHLSIAPRYNLSEEVLAALSVCPQLETFRLDLHEWAYEDVHWHTPSVTPIAVQPLASSLRAVRISGLTRASEAWALAALARHALPSLSLDYAGQREINLGWDTFSELNGPLHLRVAIRTYWPDDLSADDGILVAEMTDSHGFLRRVALHNTWELEAEEAMAHMGEGLQIDRQTPVSVTADCVLWNSVQYGLRGHANLENIVSVTLIVSPGDVEIQDTTDDATADVPEMNIKLPAMRRDPCDLDGADSEDDWSGSELSNTGLGDDEPLPVRALTLVYGGASVLPALGVKRLVDDLRIRLPVDTLTIDTRIAVPDADKLDEWKATLARTVIIAPVYVPEVDYPEPLRERADEAMSDPESPAYDEDPDSMWEGSV